MRFDGYFLSVFINLFQFPCAQRQYDVVCPKEFEMAGQTCLKYHANDRLSWKEARKECVKVDGSDLLIIRNDDIYSTITDFIDQTGHSLWVGATDTAQENNFRWVDGTTCCSPYWFPGEPNNYQSQNEDCVHIRKANNYIGLNDAVCHDRKGFVCESQGLLID